MAKGNLELRQIQLGDNADTSKNFVISVPAVADGTLTIERENGTGVLVIYASGKVTMPGNAQTWQNVAGSRELATTYTNSTQLPIQVAVNALPNSSAFLVAYIGGVAQYGGQCEATPTRVSISFTVPPGAVYSVSVNSGEATIETWAELR